MTSPTGEQYTIGRGAARAIVVEVGGGLRTFEVGHREVLDGYEMDAMATSGRGQVLVPWPNRLDHGRYAWDGQTHQVPINEVDRSNAIHGLVRFHPWTCIDLTDDRVELAHTLWPSPGYPFTFDLRITYEIDDAGLTVTTTAHNLGNEAAPYGAGQHPYLRPPSGVTVDDCSLAVPAGSYIETDDRGLPSATHAVDGSPFDFRTGRSIGALELDTAFTDLARDEQGRAHVELAAQTSVRLWMDESYPYVQIFTGDTLPATRRRKGIAVEPMTCPPNAFATGVDVRRLEPDETIAIAWGLRVTDG